MAFGFVANGNITPSRFVTPSSLDRTVVQSGSGDKPIGISGKWTHNVPGTIGGVAVDDGYCAISGMSLTVFDQADSEHGQDIWLECGATVSYGDYLKPDSSGRGITAGSDGDFYGARALSAGTVGQLIKVQVIMGSRGA